MDDDLLNPVKIDLSDYDDGDGNGDTDADNAAQSAASPPPQAPDAPPSNDVQAPSKHHTSNVPMFDVADILSSRSRRRPEWLFR